MDCRKIREAKAYRIQSACGRSMSLPHTERSTGMAHNFSAGQHDLIRDMILEGKVL